MLPRIESYLFYYAFIEHAHKLQVPTQWTKKIIPIFLNN
jgi:hypothetical protein